MVETGPIIDRNQRIKDILENSSAFLEGHFVFSSKRHGGGYVNKDAVYPNTEYVSELCGYMAEPFVGQDIDTVLGPAMGGIILAQRVAEHLTRMEGKPIFGVYADKTKSGEGFEIKRGYDKFVTGRNVLVVEDILNTGGSAKKVIAAVREAGGNVIALSALVNRGGVTAEDVGNAPIHSLLEMDMQSWEPDDCPLCRNGVPLNTDVGQGKK